jgi:erythromycin esterase-like protein
VLAYLSRIDEEGARRARERYGCFDHFSDDSAYGYAAGIGLSPSCETEVVAQLVELRRRAAEYASRDGRVAAEELFSAEQNARLVRNAEQYYRSMFGGRVESWNLRDMHMMETLQALLQWTDAHGSPARAVVWAHNSHLGDARATEMAGRGELNLGQLARQAFGRGICAIGFTTHGGTVTAARDWDDPVERRRIVPSLEGSYERLFHETDVDRFFLDLAGEPVRSALMPSRLERAIGVIYRPDTERASHYFRARLPEQFDVLIHVDVTRALTPLERWAREEMDVPETYPTGM